MGQDTAGRLKTPDAAWSPRAIEYIGFFCSFLPAGIMYALNSARLGHPEKKLPRLWLVILGFVGLLILLAFIPNERLGKLLGIGVNAAISLFFYHDQKAAFEQYLARGGNRASVRLPVVLSILFAGMLFLISSCGRYVEGVMEKHERAMNLIDAADDNSTRIATALRLLVQEGGEGSFVIFLADEKKNYYVQCAGERGKTTLHCEATSNEVIKPPFQLSETQVAQLLSLGWKSPIPGDVSYSNFYRDWDASDDRSRTQIAREIIRTLEVYRFPANQKLAVQLSLE